MESDDPVRLFAFASWRLSVKTSSGDWPEGRPASGKKSDCLAARLWLKSGAVNSVVKKAIVAICLVICGTATIMVPKAGDVNDRPKGTPIPVTNGQKARTFWLTV